MCLQNIFCIFSIWFCCGREGLLGSIVRVWVLYIWVWLYCDRTLEYVLEFLLYILQHHIAVEHCSYLTLLYCLKALFLYCCVYYIAVEHCFYIAVYIILSWGIVFIFCWIYYIAVVHCFYIAVYIILDNICTYFIRIYGRQQTVMCRVSERVSVCVQSERESECVCVDNIYIWVSVYYCI